MLLIYFRQLIAQSAKTFVHYCFIIRAVGSKNVVVRLIIYDDERIR